MKNKMCLLSILALGIGISVSAQTAASNVKSTNAMPAGILLFVDGSDFTIYRNAVLHSYDVNADNVIGMNIEQGDFVQTGRGTTLEIQMLPGQSIIKVAENTSFRVISNKTTGVSGLEILYGKIRSRVDATLGGSGFYVQGKTAIAGVRGTDFGYDVVAVPGSSNEPSSRVYTYEGTVVVQTIEKGSTAPAADAPSFEVPAGSTLTVVDTPDETSKNQAKSGADKSSVLATGERTVLINKTIAPAVDDYWKKNEFKSKQLEEDVVADIIQNYRDPQAGTATTVDAGTAQIKTQQAQTQTANKTARITAADLVEPLTVLGALDSIRQPQYVIGPEPLKTVGIISGSVGILGVLSGLAFYNFGSDIFTNLNSSDNTTLGLTVLSGSAIVLLTGMTLYVVGGAQ